MARVTVAPADTTLTVGGSAVLHATAYDGAGAVKSGATIFWSSQNTAVATVSGQGVVTALSAGTVQIAASAGGKSGIAKITVVPVPVASVQVSPTTATIVVGGEIHLQATTLDAGGNTLSGRTVTWSSSNASVASVDSTGLVTGVASSTQLVTIRATSEGKTGTATVLVTKRSPASIVVTPSPDSVTVGQSSALQATVNDSTGVPIAGATVTWTSTNPGIASVSSTGVVTGVAPGQDTIVAASGAVTARVPVTVVPLPPTSVVVSPNSKTLYVTQTLALSAQVTDQNGKVVSGAVVTWSSGNPAVATVDAASGVVTAVAPGVDTVTATSNTLTGTAVITVKLVPVVTVTLTPDNPSLYVGQTTTLVPTVSDSAGNALSLTGRAVSWSSNNAGVAAVDNTGKVTAKAAGSAVITLSVDGVKGFATVTVTQVPVATVTVTPALDSLVVGDSVQLRATAYDSAGNVLTGRSVQWSSGNSTLALVTSTGYVYTRSTTGTVVISAKIGGVTGSATIVIIPVPVATVTVSPARDTLFVGQTASFAATLKDANGNVLTGRTVTWASSDTTIAKVDATGTATAVAPGTATITATSEGKSGSATLVVRLVPVASVKVTPALDTIIVGDSVTLVATTLDSTGATLTGRTVTWTSRSTGVATVDSTGKVKGVTVGSVTIVASSEGKSDSATVVVQPVPVASVQISPSPDTVRTGKKATLTATPLDANNNPLTGRTVVWASGDTTIATVDQTGVVTGGNLGTVAITATSGGVVGTDSVTVTP